MNVSISLGLRVLIFKKNELIAFISAGLHPPEPTEAASPTTVFTCPLVRQTSQCNKLNQKNSYSIRLKQRLSRSQNVMPNRDPLCSEEDCFYNEILTGMSSKQSKQNSRKANAVQEIHKLKLNNMLMRQSY